MATVYRYLEYGPLHYQSFYASPECRKSPWRQLLYINNFIADNSGDVSFLKKDIYLKNVSCKQNFSRKVYWSNLVPSE